jgi:UDP-N-acetyl-D-glucosamine dehydrogenase
MAAHASMLLTNSRCERPQGVCDPMSGDLRHSADRIVGIVGLGYVGLPTALAFVEIGCRVIGIDLSSSRLQDIAQCRVDLTPDDLERLRRANASDLFTTTTEPRRLADVDTVLICVPTPIDSHQVPDHSFVRDACVEVVRVARPGQLIVLTSTTSVGTTRLLLAEPLERAGLRVGTDVFVAFSPERIDPGNTRYPQSEVPRVVGGMTEACAMAASKALAGMSRGVHIVSSPEAAEFCKLLENSFRAVNVALANEFADIAGELSLDITEVIGAAASKPHGFMPFYPGPGVGGHCIPCDPHFLLWHLRRHAIPAPVLTQAMSAIAHRPAKIVQRVIEQFARKGVATTNARLLVVGVAYKPGVEDVRETPAVEIIAQLESFGVDVSYFDPHVKTLVLSDRKVIESVASCDGGAYDMVLIHTLHPDFDLATISECGIVIDASYRSGLKRGTVVLA